MTIILPSLTFTVIGDSAAFGTGDLDENGIHVAGGITSLKFLETTPRISTTQGLVQSQQKSAKFS